MKIINETITGDTKITTYEGSDTTKPHCGDYCVMGETIEWQAKCIFCWKPMGDGGFTDKEEDRSETMDFSD